MNIKTLAFLLLVGRLVSLVFLLLVLVRQVRLFKIPVSLQLNRYRMVLLIICIIGIVGTFVPILIDSLTLVSAVSRGTPQPIGVAYAFSNNLTALAQAVFIWVLYRMAAGGTKKGRRL